MLHCEMIYLCSARDPCKGPWRPAPALCGYQEGDHGHGYGHINDFKPELLFLVLKGLAAL